MRVFNLLLVEDDEVDIMNVERALQKNKLVNPLYKASDGLEALQMLKGEKNHKKIETPLVILLDLNMPRMGGHEFLKILRNDPDLQSLPVMTVSTEERDKVMAYKLSVQGYIVKPLQFDEFTDCVRKIDAYWTMCELP